MFRKKDHVKIEWVNAKKVFTKQYGSLAYSHDTTWNIFNSFISLGL